MINGLYHKLERLNRTALPFVHPIDRARGAIYARRFAHSGGGYCGTFTSFAEAARSAPKSRPIGFDQPALAAMYRDRMEHAMPSDYPVLFWLSRLLRPDTELFDFGGHIGVSFHCFARYLDYPPGLRWTVLDVDAVVAEGRKIAIERHADALSFTTAIADADGCDIFMAAGSLQYIETPFAEMLAALPNKPPRLLLSKLPIHDAPTVYTIQSTGNGFHPYRLWNRGDFEGSVTRLGYRKVDEWTNGEQSCRVPYEGIDIKAYTGYLFERTDN